MPALHVTVQSPLLQLVLRPPVHDNVPDVPSPQLMLQTPPPQLELAPPEHWTMLTDWVGVVSVGSSQEFCCSSVGTQQSTEPGCEGHFPVTVLPLHPQLE